jgi:hypothetical protein
MVRRSVPLFLALLLGACAGRGSSHVGLVGPEEPAAPSGWRGTIQPQDQARLDALPAQVPALERTAALDYPQLSPGSYRCRAAAGRRADYCYVSATAEGLALAKQTGANPLSGYLHADGNRYVFLGARQRRAGDTSQAYGADPARNLVGTVERVGNFRWRLAVVGAGQPLVLELTPVPVEQQPRNQG